MNLSIEETLITDGSVKSHQNAFKGAHASREGVPPPAKTASLGE